MSIHLHGLPDCILMQTRKTTCHLYSSPAVHSYSQFCLLFLYRLPGHLSLLRCLFCMVVFTRPPSPLYFDCACIHSSSAVMLVYVLFLWMDLFVIRAEGLKSASEHQVDFVIA